MLVVQSTPGTNLDHNLSNFAFLLTSWSFASFTLTSEKSISIVSPSFLSKLQDDFSFLFADNVLNFLVFIIRVFHYCNICLVPISIYLRALLFCGHFGAITSWVFRSVWLLLDWQSRHFDFVRKYLRVTVRFVLADVNKWLHLMVEVRNHIVSHLLKNRPL